MNALQDFQYCPRCKHELNSNNNYVKCEACGFQFYDDPRPGTAVLLQNENEEYLLVRRAEEPHKGMLDLPGGFAINNETLLQGAQRELKEETGIEVSELAYHGSYPDVDLYEGITYSIIGVVFTGKIDGNQIVKLSEESTAYAFFKLVDIPLHEVAYSSIRQLFQDLQASET